MYTSDLQTVNPFLAKRHPAPAPVYAKLPQAPKNRNPVPRLTSLYHTDEVGPYGDRSYPGNCSGELIKDLLVYFEARRVLDPMTGSGTCRDVCRELGIGHVSTDLKSGVDAASAGGLGEPGRFDFVWIHPPYWRQKRYSDSPADLSAAPTLASFLAGYDRLIRNCGDVLSPGGKLAVLMGDYCDREAGFVPLVFHTKEIAFRHGLRQHCTDIIRFSHGASSGRKTYRSKFIPGLHDVCAVFERR